MKYRCRIELAAEVLSASLKSEKKTRIMNYGNLNFKQLKSYLRMLLASGMLSFDSESESYSITEKGEDYLRLFESYREHLLEMEEKRQLVDEKKNVLEQMCIPLDVSDGVQLSIEGQNEGQIRKEKLSV
jgi:predicted transcriptional regulator